MANPQSDRDELCDILENICKYKKMLNNSLTETCAPIILPQYMVDNHSIITLEVYINNLRFTSVDLQKYKYTIIENRFTPFPRTSVYFNLSTILDKYNTLKIIGKNKRNIEVARHEITNTHETILGTNPNFVSLVEEWDKCVSLLQFTNCTVGYPTLDKYIP